MYIVHVTKHIEKHCTVYTPDIYDNVTLLSRVHLPQIQISNPNIFASMLP